MRKKLLSIIALLYLTVSSAWAAVDITMIPANGGTYSVSQDGTKLYVTPATGFYLASVTKAGSDTPIESVAQIGKDPYYPISSNDYITITFEAYTNNVHVTFDLSGYSGTTPDAKDLTLGKTVSQPTGIDDYGNYILCGWSTNKKNYKENMIPYDFNTVLDKTLKYDYKKKWYKLELYAIWADKTQDYTVAFNANEGSGRMDDVSKEGGSEYTIPACGFTKARYYFIGWATKADGDVAFRPGQTIFLTDHLTLYAKWEGEACMVRFQADGGSGTMNTVKLVLGTEYTIPACGFTKEDYYFVGWATSADGDVAYQPGDKVTITDDLTLFAKWTEDFPHNGHAGTEADPYIIEYAGQLSLLAKSVNDGNGYAGKFFKLGADITYTHKAANEVGADTENNYTAIGTISKPFKGCFDGDGHTISGIRIYKGGNTEGDKCQGLFGKIGGSGTVKNLTLADARITGYKYVGGIVGYNDGTVENCHVLSNVAIHTVQSDADCQGGIVGENGGTVSHCTSAATLSLGNGASGYSYGGIAGISYGSLSDNLAIGVTVPAVEYRGAIAGDGGVNLNLQRNYYSGCTVGSATSGIGCGDLFDVNGGYITADVTENDGAVPATILSESAAVPTPLSGTVVFRRSFTGGKASTVCLPFAYTPDASEGTYYTFGGITTSGEGVNTVFTATMNENTATTLSANTPYLFMPTGAKDIVPVLFYGSADYNASSLSTTSGDWTFKGTYSRLTYGTAPFSGFVYGFASTSKTVDDGGGESHSVEAGEFVMAATGASVPPMRCFLTYKDGQEYTAARGLTRGAAIQMPDRITVRLIGKDGDINGIGTLTLSTGEFTSEGWYTLSGRRLPAKPTQKGIYIHNGKKVIK